MWSWILAVIAFLFFFIKPNFPATNLFPGIQPLISAGPVSVDWTDIIALALVGFLIYAIANNEISAVDAAKILIGALAGKALSKDK